MARKNVGLDLKPNEISTAFDMGDWAKRFPPVLSIPQVSELLQIPVATIYDWSSRGLLRGCSRKVGKHLRFWRDRVIHELFNIPE